MKDKVLNSNKVVLEIRADITKLYQTHISLAELSINLNSASVQHTHQQ